MNSRRHSYPSAFYRPNFDFDVARRIPISTFSSAWTFVHCAFPIVMILLTTFSVTLLCPLTIGHFRVLLLHLSYNLSYIAEHEMHSVDYI